MKECCMHFFALLFFANYLDGEQHRQELSLVADQHGVANERHSLFDGVLNGNWRDVLSSRCDDQLWEHTHTQGKYYWLVVDLEFNQLNIIGRNELNIFTLVGNIIFV